MDLLAFISSYSDVGAGAILVGVVVLILTGRLIPISTHRREVDREKNRGDEWKSAHAESEIGRAKALEQNGALLAGVRIADKFYKDFLPPVPDDRTIPTMSGGADVAV
jgi:hypothetical protein